MTDIAGPDFITLLVSNLDASYKFYKEQIGLMSRAKNDLMHMLSVPSHAGWLRQSSENRKIQNPGQGIIIWWLTSDATALHNDLKQRGVPIVDELRSSPFGMTFSFQDPDGYVMTVHDRG
jgi:predicted enzyme related to lactoylglutathione lyase